jgi:hypothetical protein
MSYRSVTILVPLSTHTRELGLGPETKYFVSEWPKFGLAGEGGFCVFDILSIGAGPHLWLTYVQGSIFWFENNICSPYSILKLIFFPPLATPHFSTLIVLFLP